MRSLIVVGVLGLTIGLFIDHAWVSAQRSPERSEPRFAAVPTEKGGQDIFGAYDVVKGWPKDLSTRPDHKGWTFGAGQSVFAESPNRIFVLQRGELPAVPWRRGLARAARGRATPGDRKSVV